MISLDVSRIISGKLNLQFRVRSIWSTWSASTVDSLRPVAAAKADRGSLGRGGRRSPREGRRVSPAASGLEPAVQRLEVHAPWRPRHARPGGGRRTDAPHGERRRRRDPASGASPHLRSLPTGGVELRQISRRARARPRDRSAPGRATRRQRAVPRAPASGEERPSRSRCHARHRSERSPGTVPCRRRNTVCPDSGLLLVEDDEDGREVIAAMLRHEGAHVDATFQRIRTRSERWTPRFRTFCFRTSECPKRTASLCCARCELGTSRSGGKVPALALTAYARAEDRELALRTGFDGYITKPSRFGGPGSSCSGPRLGVARGSTQHGRASPSP